MEHAVALSTRLWQLHAAGGTLSAAIECVCVCVVALFVVVIVVVFVAFVRHAVTRVCPTFSRLARQVGWVSFRVDNKSGGAQHHLPPVSLDPEQKRGRGGGGESEPFATALRVFV